MSDQTGPDFTIFAGTANPELARRIAAELSVEPAGCEIERFPDGELTVRLQESVRRREVFIVQPTSPPVNDHLVELLTFVDACRRASASRITAVVPYFGYARGDKRLCRREPITAGMVATVLQAAGVDHLLTADLHTPQIEGFFRIPVDTLTAVPALCTALRERLPDGFTVVSPDAGRVRLATEYAHRLEAPLVVLHKQRLSGTDTRATHLVGDVEGRHCLIVDDMISTGGTLLQTIAALKRAGSAPEFTVAATHGLLLNDAVERLADHGVQRLAVTDTIAPARRAGRKPMIVSVATLFAEAIRRLRADGSLEDLACAEAPRRT